MVALSPERVTKDETEFGVGGLSSQNTRWDLMNSEVMSSVLCSRGRRSVTCGGGLNVNLD